LCWVIPRLRTGWSTNLRLALYTSLDIGKNPLRGVPCSPSRDRIVDRAQRRKALGPARNEVKLTDLVDQALRAAKKKKNHLTGRQPLPREMEPTPGVRSVQSIAHGFAAGGRDDRQRTAAAGGFRVPDLHPGTHVGLRRAFPSNGSQDFQGGVPELIEIVPGGVSGSGVSRFSHASQDSLTRSRQSTRWWLLSRPQGTSEGTM